MAGRSGRAWSKDADRKWRASFTRDNVTGARLLAQRLKSEGPEAIAMGFKRDHLASEARGDMEARRLGREMVKDAMPRIQVAVFNDLGEIRAPLGVIYPGGGVKIEQTFDGEGNLVSENVIQL